MPHPGLTSLSPSSTCHVLRDRRGPTWKSPPHSRLRGPSRPRRAPATAGRRGRDCRTPRRGRQGPGGSKGGRGGRPPVRTRGATGRRGTPGVTRSPAVALRRPSGRPLWVSLRSRRTVRPRAGPCVSAGGTSGTRPGPGTRLRRPRDGRPPTSPGRLRGRVIPEGGRRRNRSPAARPTPKVVGRARRPGDDGRPTKKNRRAKEVGRVTGTPDRA